MTSSMTTDAHGVRVVTHIIPLDTPAPPCPSKSEQSQVEKPSLPYITRMFLKGEPVVLGTVQAFIGLVMMALGIISWVAGILYGEIPLGLGISCLICGSVTLSARNGTHPRLIKTTLAFNLISTLLALSGICYFCFELASTMSYVPDCGMPNGSYWECRGLVWQLRNLLYGVNGVLLVLSVLEVCICTTLVVFSCKATCKAPETDMVVKVQTTDPLCHTSREALLNAGECLGASHHPPAYQP